MIDHLDDKNYVIKQVNELIAGDIILHPIYREDGLMLINRYTSLTPSFIKKIHAHFKSNTSIIIASSQEQLQKFLNEKLYADGSFINDLKKVVESAKDNSKTSITIENYIEPSVILQTKAVEDQVKVVKIEQKEDSILTKVITTLPLWNSFELRLESSKLQARAKKIRSQLLNTLCEDKSLLDLIKKMKEYDDLLIRITDFNYFTMYKLYIKN